MHFLLYELDELYEPYDYSDEIFSILAL